MRIRIVFSILVCLVMFPFQSFTATNNLLDLSVTPKAVLFDFSNVKPGDSTTRTITVSNSGTNELTYYTESAFYSGSQEFYEQLLLTVEDHNGVIYDGKLHEFMKLSARSLQSDEEEDITFTIVVPNELGNAYQGLLAKFEIEFFGEGMLEDNIGSLPSTASNIFNYLLIGSMIFIGGIYLFVANRKKE